MRKLKTPQDVRRRNFLKTVASSGIATSSLKASTLGLGLMASRAGFAAGPNGIKRCVIVYIPDGAVPGTYKFNSDGSLAEAAEPLDAVKENVIIFDGCTTGGNGHGDGGTGVIAGSTSSQETYDVTLEGVIGDQTPFPSLHLGVETSGIRFSRRNKENITFTDNPRTAFTRLFGDTGEADEAKELVRTPFHKNLEEIRAFKTKLGQFELERLEQHEAAIEKVIANFVKEDANAGTGLEECKNKGQAMYGWENTGTSPEVGNFTKVSAMQIDTTVAALQCNLTNLVTLCFGNDSAEFNVNELAGLGTFHTAVHSGRDKPYTDFRKYLSGRFAYLINELREKTDENGDSLLDTTLVLQVTCMGNGNAHDQTNAPFAMATASKNMVGGRGFSVSHSDNLLDTVSAALGVDGQMPTYGSGPASGLLL